jgi:hypothetical protein
MWMTFLYREGCYGYHKIIHYAKMCRHSRISLSGNVEFLREAWKHQRIGLAPSAKTYIQNTISKFEGLFDQEFKPVMTHKNEGYHSELKYMIQPYAQNKTLLNIDQ